jgi:tetrahydromethanopterin:alpha-L-glutamate ligase
LVKPRIGVIGIPGKWSTETLADAVEKQTGFRLVVDMADISLDLEKTCWFPGQSIFVNWMVSLSRR